MNKFLNSILCRNVKYENINGPENANFFLDKSWKKQVQIKDENVKEDEDSDDEIEVVGMKTNNKTFFAVKDEIKEEEKKIQRGLLFQTFLFLLKSHFYIEISTNKIINNDRDQSPIRPTAPKKISKLRSLIWFSFVLRPSLRRPGEAIPL